MTRRVAITGFGVHVSVATDADEFSSALRDGRSGVRAVTGEEWPSALRVAAPSAALSVGDLALRAGFSVLAEPLLRKLYRSSPKSALSGAWSALEAVSRSGLPLPLGENCELVVTGTNLHHRPLQQALKKFEQAPDWVPPLHALQFMDTHQVGLLSEAFGIRGSGSVVGGASASSLVGLRAAFRAVRDGDARTALVVSPSSDWSKVEMQGFLLLGALADGSSEVDPSRASRPFDRAHRGFVWGEGAAALVLEDLESARERGASVFAVLESVETCLDGTHLPEPSVEGEVRVMRKALAAAGRAAGEIDLVNAHGTGSPLGDRTEAESLATVFGRGASSPLVQATKSMVGHCLPAAGLVEICAVLLQMRDGFIHGHPSLTDPIDGAGRIATATVEGAPRLVLKTSYGFGGFNAAAVLRHPAP